MKTEKTANGMRLPIRTGQKVKIILPDGRPAETTCRNILQISYNQGYIFVTFETGNSIYKDVPVAVEKKDWFFDGQYILRGQEVIMEDGNYAVVDSIFEINENGIIVITNRGNLTGDIRCFSGF